MFNVYLVSGTSWRDSSVFLEQVLCIVPLRLLAADWCMNDCDAESRHYHT